MTNFYSIKMQNSFRFILLIVFIVAITISCQSPGSEENQDNKIQKEQITISINPEVMVSQNPPFKFFVTGKKFTSAASITIDGKKMETTFVNDEELSCIVDPKLWTVNKNEEKELNVSVEDTNPNLEFSASNIKLYENHVFIEDTLDVNLGQAAYTFDQENNVYAAGAINQGYDKFDNRNIYIEKKDIRSGIWDVPTEPILKRNNHTGLENKYLGIDKNNHCHFLWIDKNYPAEDDFRLKYIRSDKYDGTWSTPETIQQFTQIRRDIRIDMDTEGNIYVFYPTVWDNKSYIVMKKREAASGKWSQEQIIVKNPNTDYDNIQILIDKNDNLYFIHMDNDKGYFFLTSKDKGETWNSQIFNHDFGRYHKIKLALNNSGDMVAIFYELNVFQLVQTTPVYLMHSKNYGETWNEKIKIFNGDLEFMEIAIDSLGNINLLMAKRTYIDKVYESNNCFTRSLDSGKTWSERNMFPSDLDWGFKTNSEGFIYMICQDMHEYLKFYLKSSRKL